MRRGGGGGGGGGRGYGNYTNPCLTMHQPWASLLVYGIKRIEGRSWASPIRGRLWIHAASKVPEEDTIKAMEDFYKEIYAVNGITDLKFPEHYPVSRLLGCVEVVGCVKCEELASWEALPEGVRLEGQTDFCWLCEQPQKLLVPFEMRGYQGVYNLERKIHEAAIRGLVPVKGLSAAIAGARAAATQFNKKDQNLVSNTTTNSYSNSTSSGRPDSKSLEEDKMLESCSFGGSGEEASVPSKTEQLNPIQVEESSSRSQTREDLKQIPGASAKIFAAAVRGLKQS
ncbi:PREDICTED: uncharacterized protein LOC105133856 isoform X2 [Populus euphratica]|uniref:Uncharacterized protein LOC105133856 isoform X2 n=1 Tax=Populus euphratica TaxID=75702 RepID=A0AAJ6UW08_POPEU|nr:PREDICTED: uncharacterized protein LOC105133856 isoform X2 [Populus euphratica]